jgi:predicted ATPase
MIVGPAFRSVLTGGPGTGKSSLIEAAEAAGIRTLPEVAREILLEPGGMELREKRPLGFAEAMFARELAGFAAGAGQAGPMLLDRGFPDIVGFLELTGLPVFTELDRACRDLRYEGPIFHARPWREIYEPDPERIQNWAEALESDAAVTAAWRRYGYELVPLPFVDVATRLDFARRVMGERRRAGGR